MRGERFSVGSGSTFAYGVLDTGYDYNLSVPDAIELGRRAIYHATHRDAYSGGSVNVFHVKETGWEFIGNYDVGELHWVRVMEQAPPHLAQNTVDCTRTV